MRVLFATGSSPRYMAPPRLAKEQVVCGPDFADERAPDGRWRTLKTPVGEYDLSVVAARLPAAQQPDVVVCLVDAARRSIPRGLRAFKCPRVLLVADTHHLKSPLLGMLRYATSEPFTRTVFLYDRHHAVLFRSAGLRNLHWFPGLTFPHSDEVVRAARSATRASRVAFVGQAASFHPRRARLLEALAARGIAFEKKQVPQVEALRFYGRSKIGFNASLNGDLNLRIFEILAAGGALLTDRLSPDSGLDEILTENREFAGYADEESLADTAASLLASPARAAAMGAAGAAWFDLNFNESRRQAAFAALAFDGCDAPMFAGDSIKLQPPLFKGELPALLRSLMVYEGVQALHQRQETVRIGLDEDAPQDFARMGRTLPRVELGAAAPGVDLLVVRSTQPVVGIAPQVWIWDAGDSDVAALAERFLAAGYEQPHRAIAWFRYPSDAVRPASAPAGLSLSSSP